MLESVIDDDSYLDPMLSDEKSVSNDERSEISENSGNDENIIDEQFTAPDWDDFDDNGDFAYLNSSTEFSESWILLWIYKYQSRFRLSDVAINSLIQFFGQVLKDTDQRDFIISLLHLTMQRNCYKLKRMRRHMLYVRNVTNYIKPQKFQKIINVNLLSFLNIQ